MTETDIANLALDILKEAPITSLNDRRPIAEWLKRNFKVTRDSTLSSADWKFAMKRAQLARDSDAPVFGWHSSYTLPSDCLRVIPITWDGAYEGVPFEHEIEGGKLLSNATEILRIRYVARTEDYDRYPAPFVEVLSARLAMKMAHWATGKVSYAQVAQSIHQEAMRNAWLINAIEGTPERAADDDWVRAR